MAARKPRIGITGPARGSTGPRFCIAVCVRLAGGRPVQLRPGDDDTLDGFDGFVISGGHDVEPVLYKRAAEVRGNYDPERDRFESAVIYGALDQDQPLLGICRGAQLLNVCRGGSLFQNLSAMHGNATRRRTILPLKDIRLVPGSRLAEIIGRARLRVNSLHNQSVDIPGAGLSIVATDERDVVQAIEDPQATFCAGVQWHPEFLLYQAATWRLFRALVRCARNRSTG